jgi:pSer/pThr/pTyr-binding forkhead associated (FHA) protein
MNIRLRIQADGQSRDFAHSGATVTIGRNPAASIVLEENSPSSVVSWDHARIDLTPGGAAITDLRSSNGTYRNNERVTGTIPLRPGDVLRLGSSGPVLTVTLIDLTPEPVAPAAKPAARAVAAPVVATPVVAKPARPKPKAPQPEISETRGILIEAIRQQSHAHSRRRNELGIVAVAAFALIAALAGGLWLFGDRLRGVRETATAAADSAQAIGGKVEGLSKDVQAMNDRLDRVAGQFETIDRRLADQEKLERGQAERLEQVARDMARQDAERQQGQNKLNDLATGLDQLNQSLAKAAERPAGQAAPPEPPANPKVTLKPGDRVEVLFRDTLVAGSLVSVNAEKITLLILDGSRRKEISMKEVKAIQTRDGVFAFNEKTGGFESAVTFFRLNPSSGTFEKMDSGVDTYMAKDAVVEGGPDRMARAFWAITAAGEKCLGLPMPESKSPKAIPAYHFKTIVTTQGEFTYVDDKQDYVFKSHQQRVAENKAATDKFWKEREEQRYKRLMEGYEAGTRRLQALAPFLWRRHWWY